MTISTAAEAAAWASSVRATWDVLVDEVRSGEVSLPEAFARGASDNDTGLIFAVKVLEVVPGIGKVRSRRTLTAVGLADDVLLGEVPKDAQSALIEAFEAPAEP